LSESVSCRSDGGIRSVAHPAAIISALPNGLRAWQFVCCPSSRRSDASPPVPTAPSFARNRHNVGGVAWFPLAPRDVYRPFYATSRGYFANVNRSNSVINTTVINNYYTCAQ
jgi:hypothetical protein